jgi:hypothetical protein
MAKGRKGRPAGPAETREVQTVAAPRCPRCQSTRRAAYRNPQRQEYAGVDAAGRPYTAIVRRRTRCLDCGLPRIDRTHVHEPAADAHASPAA